MNTINFLHDADPSERVNLLESIYQLNALPTPLLNIIDHYIGPIIQPNSSPDFWLREITYYDSKVITLAALAEGVDETTVRFYDKAYFKEVSHRMLPESIYDENFSKINEIIFLQPGLEEKTSPFFPNITVIRTHLHAMITFKVGKYEGQWIGGQCHGEGKMTYFNGNTYIGHWVNDEINGYGTMTYKSMHEYTGMWKEGIRHGEGSMKFPGRRKYGKYVGHWENGEINGKGTMTYSDGIKYIGMWKDGKRDGIGSLVSPNGRICKRGEWKSDSFFKKRKRPR